MIVSTCNGHFQLIRQTDHAELSGMLAEHWGNDTFGRPEPLAPMVLAAALHDDGWREWESHPRINPATHVPYQFTELPVPEHLAFYLRGVEQVIARDRYAGLMVSMHCEGLYNGRYGIDPSLPPAQFPPDVRHLVQQSRERLEAQQRDLRRQLREAGTPATDLEEKHVWANYKLLQIFDRLSLFLCMPPLRERTLGPAPVGYEDRDVELRLRPVDDRTVGITPYPFGATPLRVSVKAKMIPHKRYDNDEQFRDVLEQAVGVVLDFQFVHSS